MKKLLLLIFILLIGLLGIMDSSIKAEESRTMVEQFPDQSLRNEICLILNKKETDTISTDEAEEIKSLMVNARGIKNIKGIEIFKNLIMLDISENEIQEIPKELEQLKSLRILLINDNQISDLGSGILSLVNLEVLTASNNKINKLTSDIGKLVNLEQLQLQNNLIGNIPREISGLKSLELLVLEGNQIEELPKEIGGLSNLTILDLGKNRLEAIPWEIANLDKLYFLDFSANRIHHMDMHLFNKLGNIKAVYFFNQTYSETIENSSIVFQDLKIKGFEIYTLDLGFKIEQIIVKPDGTEMLLEGGIRGDYVTIPADYLDHQGEYILRTTITGGAKNSFGDEEMTPSIYEQKFKVKESSELPNNDRTLYLYGSIAAFCTGLVLIVATRIFKHRGGN